MKTCPVCQKGLTDQAKFCYFCGASLLNADPGAEPVFEAEPIEPVFEEAPVPEPIEEPEAVVEPEFAPDEAPDPVPEPEPVFAPEPEPEPVPEPEPAPVAAPAPEPVKKETPVLATDTRSLMTTAGYIFSTLLFAIPVIGLVFMIIWGCGKTKNISRKRFSLAFLIMRLICYVILLAAAVFVLICFSGKFPILTEAFAKFFA